MHRREHQFEDHNKRSRLIIILFGLDLLFLLLAFIAAVLHSEESQPFVVIFIFIDILLIAHTAIFSTKNLIMVNHLEDYFLTRDYGISSNKIHQFSKLMDENLFTYHFQPIINAKTGDIFGYEALMRTDPDKIGMAPLEILDFAVKENRLYEIEKLTFCNTLKIMYEHSEIFKSKRIFINCLSSHLLTDEDFSKLYLDYGPLFSNIIIDVEEVTFLKNSNIKLLQKRLKETNFQIALGDYGSNNINDDCFETIKPDYIKIDRTVIRYINIDIKKQLYISNLINYARQKNIKVIAEGIENYEEFEYLTSLGVDYIQGFYTAKPTPELIPVIPEDIIQKLIRINHKKFTESANEKIYETKGETELIPSDIASKMFTSIIILEKEITFKGIPEEITDLLLIIPDNHDCIVTLENQTLRAADHPCITLGKNSSLILLLVGENQLMNDGIRVPETANLTIVGDGNLTIHANRSNKVGIGGTDSQSYGNITLASSGNISVFSNGNISVGIGGGRNTSDSVIRLKSGNLLVETNGYTTVGIGSMLGNSKIEINNCSLKLKVEGTKAIGIGSIQGSVDIITAGNLNLKCYARSGIAIGVLEEGDGSIKVNGGSLFLHFNTHTGTGIGAVKDRLQIELQDVDVQITGEGSDTVGIGDHSGLSHVVVHGGILSIQLSSGNSLLTGILQQKLIIDGGNIQCDFPESIIPVNSYGTPLVAHIITNTDEFSQLVETLSYSYVYNASYSNRYPYIKVYLPENQIINEYHI